MSNINIIDAGLSFRNNMDVRKTTARIILHHAAARICTVHQVHQWHLDNGWAGIGYHFFVRKDGTIYRGRPENTVGVHASGGNYNSIGICFDYMAETSMPGIQKQAGRALVAYLKQRYGITRVQKHLEVSSTDCPGIYFPFSYIANGTGNVSAADMADGGKLEEDGSWGPVTTRRTQQFLGTVVDGIVSNQPLSNKQYLYSAHTSTWQFKTSGYSQGSEMVRALQHMIGAETDGWFGEESVMKLQAFLGVTQDASMGPDTVRAWQRYLNNH